MEFFHEPKFDFMGKKWYFIGASLLLALVGIGSMIWHRGLAYGIDFRGGTQVYVKFAQQPNIDAVRHQLDQEGLRGSTVVTYEQPSLHEYIISLDLQTTASMNALDEGKRDIVSALTKLYGNVPEGKTDFNNADRDVIENHLVAADPLLLASKGGDAANKAYQDLAKAIVNYRKAPPRSGVLSSFQELKGVPAVTSGVIDVFNRDFYLPGFAVFNTE